MLSVTGGTRGRILESLFQSRKVDPDESNDLGKIGTPTQVEQQQAVGKSRTVSSSVSRSPLRGCLRTDQVKTWEHDTRN